MCLLFVVGGGGGVVVLFSFEAAQIHLFVYTYFTSGVGLWPREKMFFH